MAKLHVTQIGGYLQKEYQGKIDMSDWQKHPDQTQRDAAFLSRALAAYALSMVASVDAATSGASVTDGGGDCGIDAIYFEPNDRVLYLVQSKWSADGSSTIDQGDVQKFLNGVKLLLDADFPKFNAKVNARKADIERALYDASAKFSLVLIHTGQAELGKEPAADLAAFTEAQNDTSELVRLKVLKQAEVHQSIAAGAAGSSIDTDIQLFEWGQVKEPHFAVYGQILASDLAALYKKSGSSLFSENLRVFLGNTDANEDIVNTALDAPTDFWYFNNGVTALCTTVTKKPIGGNSHDSGVFECRGLTVVNGAQTIGSLAAAEKKNPDPLAQVRIHIRLISLEKCPSTFAQSVTRTNNTQNAIQKRDFVALDPEQERFRRELSIEGVTYSYKSGDLAGDKATFFDLTEATLAQVSTNPDVNLPVQAKREIGRLWDDISKAPYKALFNAKVTGPDLWEKVKILRRIQEKANQVQHGKSGRDALIMVHGNRFIEWLAFNRIKGQGDTSDPAVDATTATAIDDTIAAVKGGFGDSYPANLFKNASKCKSLAKKLGLA